MTSLLSAATAGGGVLLGPNYLCKDLIKRGELVRILPDWSSGDLPVSVLTPLGIASSGRLRVVAEELSKVLKASIK
jgi:DNA-binding transcriptional LysR family regulator